MTLNNCTNLEQLRDELNAIRGREWELKIDLSALPTFSQNAPADTYGIFSWDDTRALVYDCWEWILITRDDH